MTVALFITCLTDAFYPRVGIAVVKLLEHFGCRVEFPATQTCCGQPMYNNGYHDETRRLAERMLDIFEPYDYVVTPSGSCAAMVREHYTEFFESDPQKHAKAAKLAGKTYEFIEFLLNVLKLDPRQIAPRGEGVATYHYSCHLRGIGITDEAERVLRGFDGLRYVPIEKKDQCCGFGGTFALKFGPVSGAMVRDKVACVRATQADTLVCNDAGCTMNIEGACKREQLDVRVVSLAELMAEGLGLLPGPGGAR